MLVRGFGRWRRRIGVAVHPCEPLIASMLENVSPEAFCVYGLVTRHGNDGGERSDRPTLSAVLVRLLDDGHELSDVVRFGTILHRFRNFRATVLKAIWRHAHRVFRIESGDGSTVVLVGGIGEFINASLDEFCEFGVAHLKRPGVRTEMLFN